VAEELRLQEGLRDGGAVDLHKGPLPAGAVEVDGPGDHLLARSRFAGDEDCGLRRGDLGYRFQEPHHGRGVADEVPAVEAAPQTFLQEGVFLPEAAVFHGPLHLQAQLVEIERFGQIVVGPFLDGLHGSLHGGEGRHDHHGNGGIDLLDTDQGLQAGDLQHPDIHEDQIEGRLADRLDGRSAVVGLSYRVSPPRQQGPEHGAVGPVVIHYENRVFRFHRYMSPRFQD